MGLGLVLPVLPRLLREVGHADALGWRYGAFLSVYALMQFVGAPVLGALGDRYGRRPVLLAALAGASVDYLFMALAPGFGLLFLGRTLAGLCGASMSVASAYVADVTPEGQRARRFGQLGACFGAGFILGPALGGALGESWTRAPFLAAALLGGLNLLVAGFALPESHRGRGGRLDAAALNPLAPLRWIAGFPALAAPIAAYVVLGLVGEVGGTLWVIYGEDKFRWDGFTVGLSLAGFGLFHALAQAFVTGPVTERWGERRALALGIVADSLAYVLIAFASRGWMAFALFPLFCLGGIGAPALQSLLSGQVGEDHQGRLQGVLASLGSLASVAGPLAISSAYYATRGFFPGLVWIAGAMLYLFCLPVLLGRTARRPADADRPALRGTPPGTGA
ncbi:MFS transporter [Frateuria sp. Soil773]|nr:MFS transporter [Frateuria sp. Soil773]